MTDSIEVTRKAGIYHPNVQKVVVPQQKNGLVYALINDSLLEMRTPAAHKVGFALVRQAGEASPSENIVLLINGVALNFPPKGAKQFGAALLRRADDADDFQKRVH